MRNILLLILLFNSIGGSAENSFTIYSDSQKIEHIYPIEVLEDHENVFSFEQVIKSKDFKLINKGIPNLGISRSTFWLKFEIHNITSNSNLHLILEQPNLDEVELHILSSNEKNYTPIRKGEFEAFHHKNYQHPNYIFDIHIPKNSSKTFMLKIKANEQIFLPLFVSSTNSTVQYISKQDILFSFYTGIIFVMLLYNIFIYFTVRDRIYLFYVIYILFILFTQVALKGYHFKYLMPDFPLWANKCVTLFPSITGIAAIEFIKAFLRIKEKQPHLNKIFKVLNVIFFLSIILLFFNSPDYSFKIMQTNTMMFSIYALYVGFKIMKLGYRPAKFFLLAWSILIIGAFIYVLKDYGVLPYNNFTNYTLPAGTAMEVVLLSFALADRIKILKAEKEVAQTQELNQRQENELILKNQAENLKLRVNQATEQLKSQNSELQIAYHQLENTKAELIQKEKTAALGQMAAGMAHDFNNNNTNVKLALGVIELNTSYYEEYIDLIHTVLPKAKNIDKQLKNLEDYKEQIQYAYISEDIHGSFKRANKALGKIASSTKKLQDFSKIDSKGWIKTNIIKDLKNLYDLWRPNLTEIKIKLDLTPLPDFFCNSEALNECFRNILQNAIEAIKEKNMPEQDGLITIHTALINDSAVISFTDNGIGMTKEVEQKAFDFYFTTKGAQRNGTNLSIVKTTVNAHDGHIETNTKPGEGTTITIIIPIKNI